MNRRIIIKEDQNPEKNFFVIRRDVQTVAKDRGVPVTEVIDELIEDLQNFRNPDYEKKLEAINIVGDISDNLLNSLKLYVTKMKKNFIGKENKDKKENKTEKMQSDWKQIKEAIEQAVLQGKQGTKKEIIQRLIADIGEGNFEYEFTSKEKKFILKKLNGTLDEINKQEEEERKRKEAKTRNAEKAMLQIQEIVDREYEAGNIKNKASYLSIIRDSITGENTDIDLNIKIGKEAQEHLVQMIDGRIKTEKDELYFEQVKKFTKGFQFLREYPEIVRARHGVSKMDKFADSESYNRFCSLRELLQKEYNEQLGIKLLLESGEIDDVDARILLARKEVIEKEIEEKRKTGEIR